MIVINLYLAARNRGNCFLFFYIHWDENSMSNSDFEKQSNTEQPATAVKKTWINPEIRDQSINSQTEGKESSNPTEVTPATGS